MDEALGQPNREDADRHEGDAEERVDGTEIRAPRPSRDREAQHEVRGVKEEQHEKENELIFVPFPPMAPAVAGPDRAGHECQRAEDHALMNRNVTLEVRLLVSLPEHAQGLPAAPREACVSSE